ncbi:MAG TPA: GGDEF domain-containing protein [Terracidiphilus sp.]|jgi:diguanylate cyclase (GGDEF)-like protein|nr:GGDEF domain-containing protein [Terracidiphilus sp.]
MTQPVQPAYLLASAEANWLAALEPVLQAAGARVHIALSAHAALAALTALPAPRLALLDSRLPGMDMERLLAAARADAAGQDVPIVLFSNNISENWKDRVAEGVLDDLLPLDVHPTQLAFRLDMVLRARRRARELDSLRTAAARHQITDRLTGAYTRDALLSQLFRETDRVQRMNTSLSLILFDIDDFTHWNTRLGPDACDQLLVSVVERVGKLLRSYDLLGRVGKDEFLAGLPGCSAVNAVLLAERMRMEVFAPPFPAAGASIRLTSCFGVACSQGRSPILVLREAEQALGAARDSAPDSIQSAGDCPQTHPSPVAFLNSTSGDDGMSW